MQRHKLFADIRRSEPHAFQAVDQVWLSTRDFRLHLPFKKLSPCYIGPFPIRRQVNEVTYQLQLPPRYKIRPTFHVSLLNPFSPSTTGCTKPDAPPPPEIVEEASVYQVQEILNSQRWGDRLEYWEGYGPEERSWVARVHILDPLILEEFHQNHPNRPALRGRGRPRRRVRASGAAPAGGVM